jgi:hypothetical protein
VKRIRETMKTSERKVTRVMRPKLQLIRGGALDGRGGAIATPGAVRKLVVERARGRLARGYYERASVKRRLVDTLWEELFTEV